MTAVRVYRDDGPLSRALGRTAGGRLPPLPFAVLAAAAAGVLLAAGPHPGTRIGSEPAVLVPLVVLLLAGPGSDDPHIGRLDWLVPPILRGIEYGYLAVLGDARAVPAPLVYVLLTVLALHHYDAAYRTRQGRRPPRWVRLAGLGWEGRMLFTALAGLLAPLPFAYAALAAYLGVLSGGESAATWARYGRAGGVMVDLTKRMSEGVGDGPHGEREKKA
ncbi:DUF5941 domain-containing protein [Actinomadura sp. WMMA1423]|uniref:DUF5941 domain-containing protein n=1 Tax=Actinomadura sp. WMMA1423 TaxID=2591108 RepID=UPI0011465C1F